MALIRVGDLHVHLGESHVLQGVSFEVPEGGVTALLGRNGVGKTTTLRAMMGLVPRRGTVALAGSLSHGNKRKLELAMLLAADKRVILLDEPMAGVSAEDVDELVELIRSVHKEEGKTVLMVEHRMEVVIGLAEKIAVMHHGALLAIDTPQRVMENAQVQEAYLGEPL